MVIFSKVTQYLYLIIFIVYFLALYPIHFMFLFSKKYRQRCLFLVAVRRRDLFSIQASIRSGCNVNGKNVFRAAPLHIIFEDIKNPFDSSTIQVLKLLIDAGADVNIDDSRNWTPLLYAIGANYTEEAKYLIDNKKILLNKKSSMGRTALHYAVLKNNSEIVTALLEAGADPEICDDLRLKPVQYCNHKMILDLFLKEQSKSEI